MNKVFVVAKASPVVLVAMIGALLSGCANQSVATSEADAAQARVRKLIADKAEVAVQAQRDLAAAKQEAKDQAVRKQATLDEDEVDIDYVGMPQPLLQSIAYRYGYKYLEMGKRGDLKVVNLRVTRAHVVDVLRDVGLQVDSGADVVLDKDAKVIRLIYKKG